MSARDSSNYSSGRAPVLNRISGGENQYLDTDNFTTGFRVRTDEEMGDKIDDEFLASIHSEKNMVGAEEAISGRGFDKKDWEYLDLIHYTELSTEALGLLSEV
jgi:hypothetical protein